MFRNRMISSAHALVFAVLCMPVSMMARGQSGDPSPAGPEIQGERLETTPGIAQSTSAIMQRQVSMPQVLMWRPQYEHEIELDNLQPNPDAPAVSTWPPNAPKFLGAMRPLASQTTALSFDGANSNDTNATPPDSMGTIGPSQYIVFVNGRLRSFNKTGVADGVLNVSPDTFFASVMTPVGGSVVLSFTSDPQIRYDRFTARWYLSIIDVPCTDSNCNGTAPNRWLLAVSDAASKGTITASTVWTFFYVSTDTTNFCDYPSLGIDVNALYFGCNMFGASFAGTNGYVVQKSSVQGAGPMVVTKFASLGTASSGMYTPRGVDNFDATATVGYFIGADAGFYSRINFRRVSNPGSAAPTISANIQITTPTTGATNPVEHLGNTGGNNGRLDSLDHRLFQAMIRNGHLWTAHNLRVNASGVANTGAAARKAARWYDFTMSDSSNPVLNQSGTVYDSASTLAASAQYWIPSIAATGQGHAVIGFSKAGTPFGATPSYTGRLSGDPLGTMSGVPGASMTNIGVTAASYNPSWDDGSQNGSRRWGDYSFTVVDPLDDMTVWTVQEYNEATNMYAVRVAKLLAPPPATPTCSASPISFPSGTGNVTINATSTSGSGFYDPGANLPSPARPFSHISATMTNATVNSTTYVSPTQVTLNITANVGGLQNVTIVNPDGQSVTANGCINVSAPVATKLAFTAQPPSSSASGSAFTATVTVQDASGNTMTSDNSNVALALAGGTSGANLSGTLIVQAVNGVAAFSGLSVDKAGTGYTLHATDGSLTPADSNSFNIVAGAAAAISFTTQPATNANVTAGSPITLVAHVVDGAGNAVAGESVALAIASGFAGSTLTATSPQTTNASGDATFSNVSLNKVGTGTLSATDGVLVATSNSFNIVASSPDHLTFTPAPGDIVQGQTLGNVTVTEYDAYGNQITADSTTQVSLVAGQCGGTVLGTQALNGGAVTFNTTQAFLTVTTNPASLSAAAGSNPPTPASSTFNVMLGDEIFFNGFESCTP